MEENTPISQVSTPASPAAKPEATSPTLSPSSRKSPLLVFIIVVILLIAAGAGLYWYMQTSSKSVTPLSSTLTQVPSEKNVLHVGQTIDERGLGEDTKEFQPFIDYLVKQLDSQGFSYTRGEFVGAKSVSEMAQLVREGKIDIIIDSAFPVYVVNKLAGAQVILDRWKSGVGTYHSAFFVKTGSSIQSLNDLKGKIMAVDGPTATTGYFLPKAYLINLGYTLTQKNQPTDSVAPNEIGYMFVHDKVFEDVANDMLPVGAENEDEVRGYFGDKINQYRFVGKTPEILRYLVATRADLDTRLSAVIKNILLGMDQSPEGQKVLISFAGTAKFTSVASNDAAYGIIKDLTSIVEDEIIRQ